jgi:hypothetical protein
MKNLQSLLTEKGINVLVNDQILMVRGGSKNNCKVSVKNKCSNKSFGTTKSGKCKGAPIASTIVVSKFFFPTCF